MDQPLTREKVTKSIAHISCQGLTSEMILTPAMSGNWRGLQTLCGSLPHRLPAKKKLVKYIHVTHFRNMKGGENMGKDQIKSFVACLGIASLVAGASVAATAQAASSG